MYDCKASSLTLREEHGLRVFESRVLRKTFGPEKEVAGEWRRLHNEELYAPLPSQNIIRMMKQRRMSWAGHVARLGDRRVVHRVFVGRPEGRSPTTWKTHP